MKTKTSKTYDKWTEATGGISIIGSGERFSLSIKLDDNAIFGINGCRIQDSKNGKFISFPQWKDNKGEWHKYAFVKLDDDDTKAIIDMF